MLLILHILAGSISLLAGFVALYSAKGAATHRQMGRVFVYAMLSMSMFGGSIAAIKNEAPGVNIPAAILTAYLVITGVRSVRTSPLSSRWTDVLLMLTAVGVGATCLVFGLQAVASGGKREGIPAFPFFMFAFVGILGALLDTRVVRFGSLQGATRVVQHLWRMSFALFIAALSFFLGQADVFPKVIRKPALLALPVLAVLITMFYWLWRVRIRRLLRGFTIGGKSVTDPSAV